MGTVLSGANFAVLVVAVLGVMVGAREYSSGLIRVTLAAVPSRLPVLLGKLAVFVAVATPVVAAGVLTAFFGGTAILSAAGVDSASWSDEGVTGAVLGTIGYLVGIGALGVLLGMLFRSIAAGQGVLLGGILFVPTLATALLPDSWDSVLKHLPSNAGQAFTSVTSGGTLLDYWAGVAVFSAWPLVTLVATAWAMMHRDAWPVRVRVITMARSCGRIRSRSVRPHDAPPKHDPSSGGPHSEDTSASPGPPSS